MLFCSTAGPDVVVAVTVTVPHKPFGSKAMCVCISVNVYFLLKKNVLIKSGCVCTVYLCAPPPPKKEGNKKMHRDKVRFC